MNLKQVTQANYPEKTLFMSDGQEVYMSRNSIHDVKSALAELMGGGENVGVAAG